MTFVQMNSSRSVNKGFAEQNYFKKDEEKEVRYGVEGDGQDLSEEDELRINVDVGGALDGHKELGHEQDRAPTEALYHKSEQQQEGPFVCWERFLPLRSLKVLLVENDDSTRQVVGALLRNCGYEVMAVANGLQAWRILEDLTNRVDLVLTEVVMPCLSGVGLLSKIMNHKTCKNIPVIMMSSHDSMNIVFKCLSKGAVDFLVKPIRKNELKNLWQHIWRKCRSQSSGSGSESGIQTQKSMKSKSCEESDNDAASNNEDDMESVSLNARDGSDNGSGTQSSWTKRAVEIDSPKRVSSWDQVGGPPDSTCAQVIYSRPEAFSSTWVPVTTNRDQDDELENDVMGKDMEIGAPRNPTLQIDEPSKKMPTEMAGTNGEDICNIDSKKDERSKNNQLELNSDMVNREPYNQATGQPGAISNSTDPLMESIVFNIPGGSSKVPEVKEKDIYSNEEMHCLKLSLKRSRDVQHVESNAHDRNVLRHSDLSAFSRYNSTATPNQAPTGNVGSCSPADNSSEAAKTDSTQNFQSNLISPPPNQGSNGSSNNNDMGSTTNNAVTKPPTITDKSASKFVAKCLHPSSAFQPVNGSMIPPNIQGKTDSAMANMIYTQAGGMNKHIQVQHHHHHHHYHLHHQHVQNMARMQADRDDISLEKLSAAAPQCGSSNMLSTSGKCTAANHSLNGSASGSNHGSNDQNSSNPLNGQETNNNADNKIAVKGGAMAGIGYGSTSGVEQSRNAQREAALHKFRQKRKDRCFEKKVRYHSRKKLAEQRPRVRGQFVRQVTGDYNKGKETSQTTKP